MEELFTKVTLTRFTDNPVMAAEDAASMCYKSTPTVDGRIIRHCYNSGHHSVLEHVFVTFRVEGVSRVLLAQLTRHRLISFSVESQRYVSYENGFDYVVPPAIIALGEEAVADYEAQMETINYWYRDWQTKLGGSGEKSNEDARFVLPNATCTNLICTMNLREFIHLCNERLCTRAQWEIRRMVRDMVREFNVATTNAFGDMLVPKCEKDKKHPYCTESKKDTCGRHPRLDDVYHPSIIWANRNEE